MTADRLLFWSFCGLFFFIPVATSPAVIMGALTLAIWIFSGKIVKDCKKWLNSKWIYAVLLFVLLPWFGLTYTDDLSTGLKFASKTHYWLFALAISSLSLKEYNGKTFVTSFLAGLSVTSFISLLQYVGLFPLIHPAPTAFMSHINISLFLVVGILILSFSFKTAVTVRQKVFLLGLMVLFFISLSVSTGRIGYLSFMLLSPWIFYTFFGKKYLIWALVCAAVMAVALFSFPTVQNRASIALEEVKIYHAGKKDTSIGLRLNMWEGAKKIFKEHPFIGVGTGGYKNYMARLNNHVEILSPIQPHNGFLYMAVSFGITGLVSFIWLLAVYMKKGWQARGGIVGYSILSFGFVFIIGNMTDSQMLSFSTAVMFSLLTGLSTEGGDMDEPGGLR